MHGDRLRGEHRLDLILGLERSHSGGGRLHPLREFIGSDRQSAEDFRNSVRLKSWLFEPASASIASGMTPTSGPVPAFVSTFASCSS